MARRTMREHDVVIVDYSDLNAIAIVTDRSEDPKITQGIGGPGVPAFRLQYVAGLTMVEDKVEPAVGFIWLNDDPEHISIVGVNGCLLPSTFYGVDMVQAFRDIGVDCGDGTESDDASSKLISDFISNEPLDQVLSADAWRLDDYPPRRRLDLLARAQKTLEFTDGAREKAADEVATARQAFENACAVLRKRLVWAVWCVAIIPGAYFAIAACRADVETAGRLRGIITLLMAIVFGVGSVGGARRAGEFHVCPGAEDRADFENDSAGIPRWDSDWRHHRAAYESCDSRFRASYDAMGCAAASVQDGTVAHAARRTVRSASPI